ncbi:MAG: hypothetical protein WBL19_01800 [Minisyncoccia bacterium]
MKRYAKRISAFLLVFILVFGISGVIAPQTADAWIFEYIQCALSNSSFACALRGLVTGLMEAVLAIAGLITGLAGVMLNGVVYHTVVNVAQNYANIPAIDAAWTTVRDLANMVFIFLLLYAAIRIILGWGEDSKRLIVNIIIVAILINFSLFFTRIVIDASNMLALFFYGAISPGASVNNFSLDPGSTSIADQFMSRLELTNLYNAEGVETSTIFVMGIMGTMMLMIAAFVFFSISIMFIVRYVMLIFVLILSPLAFLSYAFPALRGAGSKWLDTLIGQSFFAPIYFMITWIALRVLGDVARVLGIDTGDLQDARNSISQIATAQPGQLTIEPFMVILNFLIVIVFLLASLSIAKSWANRAGNSAQKANKWLAGAAVGTAAFAGRQTVGRYAARTAERGDLKERALAGDRGARLQLWAARKGAAASFDARGAGLGIGAAMDMGKAGGKGGYAEFRKKQDDKLEKIAKSYGPSEVEIDQAKQALARAKESGTEQERREAQARVDQLVGIKGGKEGKKEIASRKEDLRRRKEQALKNDANLQSSINKELDIEEQIRDQEREVSIAANPHLKREREMKLDELKTQLEKQKQASKALSSSITEAFDKEIEGIKETSSLAEKHKLAYASMIEKDFIPTILGYNKTAAAKIRAGKSKKDQAVEALKGLQEEGVIEGGAEKEAAEPETSPETTNSEGNPKAA